jgi:hypothetical protein
MQSGRWTEAISVLRGCLARQPGYAAGWCDLGHALVAAGEFAEARECYAKCHELASSRGEETLLRSSSWVEDIDRLVEAGSRLATIEDEIPSGLDPVSEFALARAAFFGGRHLTAARLFRDIVSGSDDPSGESVEVRLLAAKAAASAGAGGGKERTGEAEAASFRADAVGLMRGVLDALESNEVPGLGDAGIRTVARTLCWDPAFAGVRDEARLSALPDAEREAWTAIWKHARRIAGIAETR